MPLDSAVNNRRESLNALAYLFASALVDVFHHRKTDCWGDLLAASAYGDRLAAGNDLGCVRTQPIQDRQEDRESTRTAQLKLIKAGVH